MARYKPFLKYDTPRFKITLRKKVKEIWWLKKEK
jgi:hypothetical protein